MIADHYSLNSTVCALIILSYKHNSRKTASSNDVYHSIFRIFSVWYSHNSILHSIKRDSVLVVHICVSVCEHLDGEVFVAHWRIGSSSHTECVLLFKGCLWGVVVIVTSDPEGSPAYGPLWPEHTVTRTHTHIHTHSTRRQWRTLYSPLTAAGHTGTHTHTWHRGLARKCACVKFYRFV